MGKKGKLLKEDFLGEAFRESKKETVTYLKRPTLELDKDGILIYKIPYDEKFEYYPIFIARYSIGNLELYLDTHEEKYKKVFLKHTNWLLNNLIYKDKFAVWEHHYKLPYYDLKIPWIHGLGQGLGMIALLKTYQITKNEEYLKASKQVFNSFDIEISNGGVKYIDENKNIWLEEYATLPAPHVLNGFITILFCIHEFHKVTKTKKAQTLFNKGMKTIKTHINQYEAGYWSYYDLLKKYPSTKSYHNLHVRQLKMLYKLTNDKIFQEYSKKWDNYNKRLVNRKCAGFKRGITHIKRNGIIKSYNLYMKRKKWNKE